MDAPIASLIVVGIGAVALVVAAWLTARARIGLLPAKADPSSPWAGLPDSARQSRIFGWVFVLLLYLLAVFCLLQGLNNLRVVHHWAQLQVVFGSTLDSQADITLYAELWIATAIVLCLVSYWAQRRLKRRAA